MATYRGSYIASAYRARIDCSVADKGGDSTKSVVTVKLYLEMASGAKDGAWNFDGRGAVGADSSWSSWTTGASTYLNSGATYYFGQYTREYSKAASTQSVMCYGQVRNTFTASWAGPSDARGSVTIPALATSTVSYDGNKPTGATGDVTGLPSSQAKVRGQTLTLATATPSLVDYVFDSWNTAADGTGTEYAPGDSYATDAALALYAQWVPAQVAPTISRFESYRSDDQGNRATNSTTHVTFAVSWATTDSTIASLGIEWADSGGDRSDTPTVSGGSATDVTYTYAASSGASYASGASYQATLTVTDSNGLSTVATVTIPPCSFAISFGYGGQSVGFGALASNSSAGITFGEDMPPTFETATAQSRWRSALGIDAALIRSLTQWTQIATTTNTTATALSGVTGYNELLVICKYSTTYAGSVVIPVAELSTTATDWYLGAWGNSGNDYGAACKLTTTQITPYSIRVGGSAVSSNVSWTVYAR